MRRNRICSRIYSLDEYVPRFSSFAVYSTKRSVQSDRTAISVYAIYLYISVFKGVSRKMVIFLFAWARTYLRSIHSGSQWEEAALSASLNLCTFLDPILWFFDILHQKLPNLLCVPVKVRNSCNTLWLIWLCIILILNDDELIIACHQWTIF